jgi:hypothetical protein
MDLEETEARNDCAGEGQQQFNRPTEANQSTVIKNLERRVSVQFAVGRQTRRRSSRMVTLVWGVEGGRAPISYETGPATKYVNTEAEEAKSMEDVTKQPVKIWQPEKA